MQISNVSAGYSDPATLARRGEIADTDNSRSRQTIQLKDTATATPSSLLSEVIAKYDVTDITPMDFSSMVQNLFEIGAITTEELQQLAVVGHDLDIEGIDPDESVNLIEFYTDKIEQLQRDREGVDTVPLPHQQLGPLLGRLDWIEKFALIQSAPDAIGLDTVA
ncbi:MAG TPA: hypothetical protein VE890_10375 [Thermoguttaceae bacterium]|nr:hypothetical protein [Thermoguttaceae bacterium]